MAAYLQYRALGQDLGNYQASLYLLPELETFASFRSHEGAYVVSAYAMNFLVDGNDRLLFEYYTTIGQQSLHSDEWKTYFENTFGISVEEFYARLVH